MLFLLFFAALLFAALLPHAAAAFDNDEKYEGVQPRAGMTIPQTYTIEHMPASWWFTDNGDRMWFMMTNGTWGIVRGDGELIYYPPFRKGERNTRYEEMEMLRLWNTLYTQSAYTIVQPPAPEQQYADKHIQTEGAIKGWVDILGFNTSVKKNGTLSLPGNGNGSEYALVQYRTWEHWKPPPCYDNCYVAAWDRDLAVTDVTNGTVTEARLKTTLVWYEKICGKNGCYRRYHTDKAEFIDQEATPLRYPNLSEPTVVVTQYNNTLYENIGIRVYTNDSANITEITFRYGDRQAVRNYQTLRIGQSIKNVTYGTLVELKTWETSGAGISRVGDEIMIAGNITKLNLSEFEITLHDPYKSRSANWSNYTVLRSEFRPAEGLMNPVLFVLIGILGTIGMGILYLFLRMI